MSYRFVSAPNVSACQNNQQEFQINQINEVLFWTAAAVSTLMTILGTIANCLVIYFSIQEPWTGTLRHLNKAVKHLAVSNLLYGLLGCPMSLAYWKMGKT